MARRMRVNRKTAMLIGAVGVVAVGTWGLYAWRLARQSDAPPIAPSESMAQAPEAGADAGTRLTSLRATRPAAPIERRPDLTSSVKPNAPASIGNPVEEAIAPPLQPDTLSTVLAAEPTGLPPGGSPPDLAAAESALERGEWVVARRALSQALDLDLSPVEEERIRKKLTRLSEAMLFSRAILEDDPLTDAHVVQSGDSLSLIAKRHDITEALLMSVNGMTNPDRLYVGARLKIIRGPFRAVIWKSQHRLDLYLGDTYIRSMPVGLGLDGGTPLGQWTIRNKLINPDWTDPRDGRHYPADDPDNPIGERWIGLDCVDGDCLGRTGFGIHGTIDRASIGADRSMGCVRLAPEDVERLYDLLVPHRSRVDIRP